MVKVLWIAVGSSGIIEFDLRKFLGFQDCSEMGVGIVRWVRQDSTVELECN